MNLAVLIAVFCSFSLGIFAQSRVLDNGRLLELYQTQKYGEAATYLKSFYSDPITDPSILNRLAFCYRMSGNYQQAERYYMQLYALDSLNSSTLLNLAAVKTQRGLFRPAADYYLKLIAIDSNYVQALTALSTIMSRLGKADSAFRYLERANRLLPTNGDIAFDFAQLCMNRRDEAGYQRADTVLQTALQSDPENGLLLLAKAQTADKLGNYKEVVKRCEKLTQQGEETLQVLTLLAKGYFLTDDFIRCKDTYEKALGQYSGIPELDYYYLAMAYKALKEYKAGLDCMDKVLELAISPNTALYYGRKADLHDLANQPSAAAAAYLRSFQFEKIPLHYYSLAVLYDKKLQHRNNALRYYRLYLQQKTGAAEKIYVDYVQKRIKELE